MKTPFVSASAAVIVASVASADITINFTNQTLLGFNFLQVVGSAAGVGGCTGTLTAVQVNATLDASVAYTYADDLCIYVDPEPLTTGGLLQVGGYSSLQALERYFWPNGGSSEPGTVVEATVEVTPITFNGVPGAGNDPAIWLGNGYGASGTSGTWTGSVTLIGVDRLPLPPYDPCAPGNPVLAPGPNTVFYRGDDSVANRAVCGGTIHKANVYRFTAAATGSHTFESCPSSVAVRLAVFDGCAPNAAPLACGAAACGGLGASATLELQQGAVVFLAVGGADASTVVPEGLTISVASPPEPPNPACLNGVVATYGDNLIDAQPNTAPNQSVFTNVGQTAFATIFNAQWLKFTPTATGQFTFKICEAGDTKLAIATSCVSVNSRLGTIAYNDDASPAVCPSTPGGPNWGSWIDATNGGATGTGAGFPLTQDLVAGQTYYICVGGFGSGNSIFGNLNISGPEGPACPADLNNNGIVNGDDLGILLTAWGACPAEGSCPADLNNSGIVNGDDLGILLTAWGACPN